MAKRILIIINNLGVGGAERLVVDDINEMLRIGVTVTLITLKPEPKKSFIAELRLEQDKFHCIPFKHFLDVPSWRTLVRSIRASEPDLVITQLWFANTIGRIAAKISGVKDVVSFEQNVYDQVKTEKMFLIDQWLQFLSKKIIAVSGAVKRSLIGHSIQEARIAVLHNSIDVSKFLIPRHGLGVRREFGIPGHAFLYLCIGRLIHQKAVDILIAAFRRVDAETFLLIVGQGKDRGALERQVQESGLEGRVIFTGVRDDIPQLLLSADCFILPSRYEGLPLVLIEALAAGAPIIVSDFESSREVITHGENGLVVPREDVGALSQAMERIKEDGVLRGRLSSGSRKSAERFSVARHVQALLRYSNA